MTAAAFAAVVRQAGEPVTVWREGACLGEGYARFQGTFRRGDRQYGPTDLGLGREEEVVCYGEAGLPLDPRPGRTLVKTGQGLFRVRWAEPVCLGGQVIYWKAGLTWQEEDET